MNTMGQYIADQVEKGKAFNRNKLQSIMQQQASDLGFAGINVRVEGADQVPAEDWMPEEEYKQMMIVLTEVAAEKKRIFSKYGIRNFSPLVWAPILNEEVLKTTYIDYSCLKICGWSLFRLRPLP